MKTILIAIALLATAYGVGDILMQDAAYGDCIGNGPSKCSPAGSSDLGIICLSVALPVLLWWGIGTLDSKSSRKR